MFFETAKRFQLDPYTLMLKGGEDYRLIFTSPKKKYETLLKIMSEAGANIFRIGEISVAPGVFLVDGKGNKSEITFEGYEHST